ncbi:hypothetical protein LVISKB_2053 [Levilactobacillus brevis KB290]|uniref:Uncharacterized protein n=2 Tax=Levilactobacillus brevis TaxID=1580 RepID=Q03NU8_LEVBA|nr:hypothetical protein LVIS_2068 [Levilactobacillus brevis ATCC 367]BAN07688.1 hypothetical protein LVISKB_2053 [Levilactobacillus brevis KB290]
MSVADWETLMLLVVVWLPMIWVGRPPKRHG